MGLVVVLVVGLTSLPALAQKSRMGVPPPPPKLTPKSEPKVEPNPEVVRGRLERLGLGITAFAEGSRLNGEQWINQSRLDESFNYTSEGFLAASAWALFTYSENLRWGPGINIFGPYSSGGNNQFGFGFLSEAYFAGEFSFPVAEKFMGVLGGRGGFGLLVPGDDFANEIRRLRADGAGVWTVPRLGWLLALNAGARRPLIDRLWARLDAWGQMSQLFLFWTDERVQGLRFQKRWFTHSLRAGLTLSLEVAF
jgi:hypothetical protein